MDLSHTISIVVVALAGLGIVSTLAWMVLLWSRKRLIADHRQQLDEMRENLQAFQRQAASKEAELNAALKVSEALAEEQLKHHEVLNTELVKSQQKLAKEFELLSTKVFEESRKKFESDSKKTLDSTLDPLKKEIEGFRKRVEETHKEDIAGRSRLEGQIQEMQKQATQIGQDAIQLATALKGENKSQGNWGEMVLERLLEDSGLEKGREYETQNAYQDEQGARKQPDVVVHLPDNKDIVIDAKVSLKAYEAYFNAETDAERDQALKDHITSIRGHFNGLSGKNYEQLDNINSLDFVFMFVSVEPAYTLALQADQSLFQQAYDKSVVLVGPTTLMATLRTVANIWRYEKQNRYAQQIADEAGGLYDQFALLVESLDEIGKKIDATQASYDTARKRLSGGRGNLVRRVENLKKLGAKSKKTLPDSAKRLLDD